MVKNSMQSKSPSTPPFEIPLPDSSAPASKPTYERLTPEQIKRVLDGFKKDLKVGRLQLEPDAPETE